MTRSVWGLIFYPPSWKKFTFSGGFYLTGRLALQQERQAAAEEERIKAAVEKARLEEARRKEEEEYYFRLFSLYFY